MLFPKELHFTKKRELYYFWFEFISLEKIYYFFIYMYYIFKNLNQSFLSQDIHKLIYDQWFCQVRVHPVPKAVLSIDATRVRRARNDKNAIKVQLCLKRANPARRLHAGDPGHLQVHDDHVEGVPGARADLLDGVLTAADARDITEDKCELPGRHAVHHIIVFDQQQVKVVRDKHTTALSGGRGQRSQRNALVDPTAGHGRGQALRARRPHRRRAPGVLPYAIHKVRGVERPRQLVLELAEAGLQRAELVAFGDDDENDVGVFVVEHGLRRHVRGTGEEERLAGRRLLRGLVHGGGGRRRAVRTEVNVAEVLNGLCRDSELVQVEGDCVRTLLQRGRHDLRVGPFVAVDVRAHQHAVRRDMHRLAGGKNNVPAATLHARDGDGHVHAVDGTTHHTSAQQIERRQLLQRFDGEREVHLHRLQRLRPHVQEQS
eukprot:PhM_4_TR14110/c1_g1_i1/m.43055